ncbi:MAG TPA: hydroxymethylbilane synthase [Candidatus Limnocylindria bacterium]|nr:hydroxymethylbilane synthase [Candidatus Limnocylindria bacterium]
MTAVATLRIGTRASKLALAQTEIVLSALQDAGFAGPMQVLSSTTRGDAISERRPNGRWELTDGQFTSELERKLLAGGVDLVVHSFKDLPTAMNPRLAIAAVLQRGEARDCLLTRDGSAWEELPFGAHVATSSARRAAQLAALRPDLVATPIRGNVESRLARLERGEFEALLLAAVGLQRIGIAVPRAALLPFDAMLPAPAQGALAVQIRADDETLCDRLRAVDHAPTRIAVEAERSLLSQVGGGCLAPLGALGEVHDHELRLRAAYETPDGRFVKVDARGSAAAPRAVVDEAAAALGRASLA